MFGFRRRNPRTYTEHFDRLAADQVALDQLGDVGLVTPPYQWDLEDANHRSATTSSPPPQAHL